MTYIYTPVRLYGIECAACGEQFEDDGFTWFGELEWTRDLAEDNDWRRLGGDREIWLCPKHADDPPKRLHPHDPYRDVDSVTLQCDKPGCTRIFEPEYVEDDECSVDDEANWYGWGTDGEHGRHRCPEHAKPDGDAYRTTYDSTKQGKYGHVR